MGKKLWECAVSARASVVKFFSKRVSKENSTKDSDIRTSGRSFFNEPDFVQDRSVSAIKHGLFKETADSLEISDQSWSSHAFVFARKVVASLCAFTIGFTPIAYSIAPSHVYAQQIIIDPSAPSTSLFS